MHTYTHSRHYQLFAVILGGAEHKTGDHTGSPLRYIIESGKRLKIIKSRGVYVAFYTSMRIGNNVLFP